MEQVYYRYSEAFKRHVVSEIESAKFKSQKEARERYGIKGVNTIRLWLKKYGKEHLLPKKVRIEMPEEQDEVKRLKRQIKELEKALSETRVGEVLNQAYFELVCEEHGITDFEGYKKKAASKLFQEVK